MSWEKIDENTYQYNEGGVRFFLLMGKKEAMWDPALRVRLSMRQLMAKRSDTWKNHK